ncbi:hypothetical protein [Ignicoccus islandicus]|uniref:hypothetical protein n=1 Tax=Ignicoccus islandicus TaxID=54259 RepID=UPI00143B4F16|nr:hypothetical protein [Ignicoccus islandicus]
MAYEVKIVAINATLAPTTTVSVDPNGCLETLTVREVAFVKNGVTMKGYLIEGSSECRRVPVTVACPCGLMELAPIQVATTQCVSEGSTYLVTASNLPVLPLLAPLFQNFLRKRGVGRNNGSFPGQIEGRLGERNRRKAQETRSSLG